MKRGQPYLGAFLLKDENADRDIISDVSDVHEVGVFAQVTSVFPAGGVKEGGTEGDETEGLTAVLYPHRRIRITELVKSGVEANVEDVHSPEDAQTVTPPPTPSTPSAPEGSPVATTFLYSHNISIAAIENLPTATYTKDAPQIRALTSEIISVFKDIAQLNPLFRDQITNFSINQVSTLWYFSDNHLLIKSHRSLQTFSMNQTNSPISQQLYQAVEAEVPQVQKAWKNSRVFLNL